MARPLRCSRRPSTQSLRSHRCPGHIRLCLYNSPGPLRCSRKSRTQRCRSHRCPPSTRRRLPNNLHHRTRPGNRRCRNRCRRHKRRRSGTGWACSRQCSWRSRVLRNPGDIPLRGSLPLHTYLPSRHALRHPAPRYPVFHRQSPRLHRVHRLARHRPARSSPLPRPRHRLRPIDQQPVRCPQRNPAGSPRLRAPSVDWCNSPAG